MHADRTATPAEALADALLRVEGTLVQIVDHMARCAHRVPADAPSLPERLLQLLTDTLGPLAESRGDTVAEAVRLIDEALDVIADEIYLVPLDAPPLARPRTGNRAERRARRPR